MTQAQRWAALEDPDGYRRHVREVLVGTLAQQAERTEEEMTIYQLHKAIGHPVLLELRELESEGVIEHYGAGFRLTAAAELALARLRR